MEYDMNERKSGNAKVYIVLLSVALVIALLWATGLIRWEDSSKERTAFSGEMIYDEDGDITVPVDEWRALQNEVQQLRQEVEQLKSGRHNGRVAVKAQVQAKEVSNQLLRNQMKYKRRMLIILMHSYWRIIIMTGWSLMLLWL